MSPSFVCRKALTALGGGARAACRGAGSPVVHGPAARALDLQLEEAADSGEFAAALAAAWLPRPLLPATMSW